MFAPMYHSVTLTGLFDALGSGRGGDFATAWTAAGNDVAEAWQHYLANDNNGRKVVIVSHSQGSFHAIRLLKEVIDPDPAQRSLLLSAMIMGGSVHVPRGKDIGGDLKNIPLCRSETQIGCVITYSTFRASVPPLPGSLFGAPDAASNTVAGCTNPANLAGGKGNLDSIVSKEAAFSDAARGGALATERARVSGLVSAECAEAGDYRFLAATVNADPNDPRADDIPGDGLPNWGLHGADLDVSYFDLLRIATAQTKAAAA
jgi:hypothetical protein